MKAPEFTLSWERVREPEAAMPEKRAQPMFAMPAENISWFELSRSPSRAARDLPMELPSRVQSRAMAMAGEISMLMLSRLRLVGRVSPHSLALSPGRRATEKPSMYLLAKYAMKEERTSVTATFGSRLKNLPMKMKHRAVAMLRLRVAQ